MPYASYTLPGGGTAYADGDYSTATEIQPSPLITYPFEQDQTAFEVRRRYMILRSSYSPQALDTADATYTQAYLVAETPTGNPGADLLEFERVYATIPAARDEREGYPFEYPGASASVAAISYATLSGVTFCSTTGVLAWSSGVSAVTGDLVGIRYTRASDYTFLDGSTGSITFGAVERKRATGTNAIKIRPAPNRITSVSESITAAAAANLSTVGNRLPRTIVTNSRVLVEYILPGVTPGIAEPDDIALEQEFRVLDRFGQETNICTGTTIPSVQDYRGYVAAEQEVVAEDGQLVRYRGNIYERRTRFVRAQ